MSQLEKNIIRVLREEYERMLGEFDLKSYKGQQSEVPVVSPGLKVRHEKTNLLYTVLEVSKNYIVLSTPDGSEFIVSLKDFSKEYKLD